MQRRLLQVLQHAACFNGDGQVGGVDFTHRMQSLQAQHQLAAAVVWRGAHHQAGVAALRHQADAGAYAGLDNLSHLVGIARANHGQGFAVRAFAPVDFPCAQIALCEHMVRAANTAQLV